MNSDLVLHLCLCVRYTMFIMVEAVIGKSSHGSDLWFTHCAGHLLSHRQNIYLPLTRSHLHFTFQRTFSLFYKIKMLQVL